MQRRVPAERARHAKRLGHVEDYVILSSTTSQSSNATPSPSPTTTPSTSSPSSSSTTTTTTTTTTTSASSSSSSSPPSRSSSPVLLSSTITSSLSSTPSSPLVTQPTLSSSASPTSSAPSHAGAVTNNGLSGGAIAGIIAGAVVVGVALIVFFVRKTYLRRRERKRISWDATPALAAGFLNDSKFPGLSGHQASFASLPSTPKRSAPLSPFEPRGQPTYSTPVTPAVRVQPHNVPTPPPATYNNPPAQHSPGVPPPSARAQHAPMEATVKFTFVPTLPDELSISTGERIFIVEQYDDGWDLCANGRGERGMVPRECLELAPIDPPGIGWRNMARTSSIIPDGARY